MSNRPLHRSNEKIYLQQRHEKSDSISFVVKEEFIQRKCFSKDLPKYLVLMGIKRAMKSIAENE